MIAQSNLKAQVKCESCGEAYEVNAAELTKYRTTKSKGTTKTELQGIALIRKPKYSYYAKKIDCPHCKRTTYVEVININELTEQLQQPLLTIGIRTLIQMAIGGLVILLIASIPIHFINLQNQKKVEEMERQYYEDIKDRYGF